jgi:hypothetical protein
VKRFVRAQELCKKSPNCVLRGAGAGKLSKPIESRVTGPDSSFYATPPLRNKSGEQKEREKKSLN